MHRTLPSRALRRASAVGAVTVAVVGLSTTAAFAAVSGTVNVATGETLTVRSTPSTSASTVASLADGAGISISCKTTGTTVTGTYGTMSQWDKLSNGYVSHAHVYSTVAIPSCTPPASPSTGVVNVAAGNTLSIRSTPNTPAPRSAASLTARL